MPSRQVRAEFTDHTITVYQAYAPQIAEPALAAGTFVPPFRLGRMTWIKPSFLWMMYRSGWATKPGQEHVLAIDITREGFEWALARATLSYYESGAYSSRQEWAALMRESPVRVQWDPERTVTLDPLPWRSLQVGLSGEAVGKYVHEWITGIRDVTAAAHCIHDLLVTGDIAAARELLPVEREYPLSSPIRTAIAATESA